jgi:hypothetical protein
MSRAIIMFEDGDDNGELTNTNAASISLLLLSRKRPRNKEEISNHAHPPNENDPGNKTAAGPADFVVDLELADEVEVPVSAHKKRKRRTVVKNDAAGKYAQIPKAVSEEGVGSEDSQVAAHRESHEGITAAATASHPMNSDSEQASGDDGSTNKHSQKLSTSEIQWQSRVSAWKDRLSELADYRKIYGDCNVPKRYSENTKLAIWVATQRKQYKFHLKGMQSPMTLARIQDLDSLGFEWKPSRVYDTAAWEARLSELADYRKIQGHCKVPTIYSENTKLSHWVRSQRTQYKLQLDGKPSHMTLPRFQALKSLGFEWNTRSASWEVRLSELVDYRKLHGHCNVPQHYIENSKLARWVGNQRKIYWLHQEGKTSSMTLSHIQELEDMGFEWKPPMGRGKSKPKNLSLEDDTACVRERAVEAPEHVQTTAQSR